MIQADIHAGKQISGLAAQFFRPPIIFNIIEKIHKG
jgi:hypothetical protein